MITLPAKYEVNVTHTGSINDGEQNLPTGDKVW